MEQRQIRRRCASARVGLGVMGFHSFLQAQNVPSESVIAKVWNKRMFKHIRAQADAASHDAGARSAAPARMPPITASWSASRHKMSIAPTASISIIAGNSSPGIEPIAANVFLQKTLSGSFSVRNRHLQKLLARRAWMTRRCGPPSPPPRAGAASGFPDRAGEGGVQDRLRAGSALDHRACGRPRAVHLPEPVGQRLPAGQCA